VLVDHPAAAYLHSIATAQSPTTVRHNRRRRSPLFKRSSALRQTGPVFRVVVIGGMSFTGFWADLSKRYEEQRGVRVELISNR